MSQKLCLVLLGSAGNGERVLPLCPDAMPRAQPKSSLIKKCEPRG